ncbi:MAG: 50S ribosomal protein L25 [Candidatus Glassbacteria bacterium]|nr:50S ribosomal protein L25 [Candidatus Glassbacteria bacterium]
MTVEKKLKAETRDNFGKNEMRRLRRAGRVPGIVYGPGEEPLSVWLDHKEVAHLLHGITVENTVIDLSISGKVNRNHQTLIREVQRHPYKPEIQHLDFYCLAKGRSVNVEVPIVLHGTPVGVRNQGGLVQHVLRDLEILVLPAQIPEHIVVDITDLEIGDSIHVEDLDLGEFEVLTDLKTAVVSVIPPTLVKEPTAEEEEAAAEELAVGEEPEEPEIIGRERESEE